MRLLYFYLISIAVILVDHIVKLVVHFNMQMYKAGEIRVIGDFFKLHYTLNPGMAFGIELGSPYGKLILTSFRIVATIGIAYYIYWNYKKEANKGLLICLSLILGGAVGNLVDSIFYGIALDNAPYDAPYALLHGQVIDMFYLDIWEGYVADWMPILGGQYLSLWPIFNLADASIFVGIAIMLIFQNKIFGENPSKAG